MAAPALTLLRRAEVAAALRALAPSLMDCVRSTYLDFGEGRAINPHSLFLLPPDRSLGRIIALPAGNFGESPAMGLKWISSFPDNILHGLDRASAVIVVNDPQTGYATTIMEGALISAWRTAISAALACRLLSPQRVGRAVAVIGCGVIARRTLEVLTDDGWAFEEIRLFDTAPKRARIFAERVERPDRRAVACNTAEEAVRGAAVVIFATTAPAPWFATSAALAHAPTVLHLSLRDIHPALILESQNFTDDVEHATRAGTSLELAGVQTGGFDFIAGDMHALITGRAARVPGRTAVFSPFGLGILDIALASAVAKHAETGIIVENFYENEE